MSMSCQYGPSYPTLMEAFHPQQPFALPVVEKQQFLSLEYILKQLFKVTMQNTRQLNQILQEV